MGKLLIAIAVLAGCGGAPAVEMLSDGQACVSSNQCLGDTPLDDIAPGVRISSVGGTCYLDACCTEYESAGWRCVVCDRKPTCWQIRTSY
jgi:hypothetical protein